MIRYFKSHANFIVQVRWRSPYADPDHELLDVLQLDHAECHVITRFLFHPTGKEER